MDLKRVNFFRQLKVLVWRYATLILNDRLTVAALLLQAPVMVLILRIVGVRDCFTSGLVTLASQTILFTLCVMASFMGILDSYREICKEHDIIQREHGVGVSLLAMVLSKLLVLCVVGLVQGLILTAGFLFLIDLPAQGLLLGMFPELFISVWLVIISSVSMGLFISAALSSSESATLPVLFIIIAQVVFSGCVFELSGGMEYIGNLVVARWGMGALGASTNLNDRLRWLKIDHPMYSHTPENLLLSWRALLIIIVVCTAAAYLVLRLRMEWKNRR